MAWGRDAIDSKGGLSATVLCRGGTERGVGGQFGHGEEGEWKKKKTAGERSANMIRVSVIIAG